MENYLLLVEMIFKQTREDYCKALRRLEKHPNDRYAQNRIREVEVFLKSEWAFMLTNGNINPRLVIKLMRENPEVRRKHIGQFR